MKGSIESEELELLLHFPVEFSSGSPVSFLSAQAWGAIRVNTISYLINISIFEAVYFRTFKRVVWNFRNIIFIVMLCLQVLISIILS